MECHQVILLYRGRTSRRSIYDNVAAITEFAAICCHANNYKTTLSR
jgi:hypothetical protein